jgi:hypothetical protein
VRNGIRQVSTVISRKGTFNNANVGVIEGEPIPQMVSLKEALKA